MKKIILSGLLLSAFLRQSVFAQAMGNNQYNEASGNYNYNNYSKYNGRQPLSQISYLNNEEIQVSVSGLMNIVADNYVAIFNILQVGETAENTDAMMAQRISLFKQKLKQAAVDTSDIKVDMISFVPKFDFQQDGKVFSRSYNEVPAGFELQKNVSVRFRNSAKLDDIVTAAASSEIYDLVKVDYFIPNLQRSMDSLRMRCINEFKSKVKSYEFLGFRLDTLKKTMSDNFATAYPPTRYTTYQAFSRPSLHAAKKKNQPVGYEVPKNNTKYYSQLEYDHYDLVVNPVITEPAVQLSYSITVKYFLTEKASVKNNYYLLTPGGDLKQVYVK